MADDVCIRLGTYAVMFILAFWCAAIAAPIMWRLEYDRENGWPAVTCFVSDWRCCRISCGKSGCSYQPRWIVTFNKTDGTSYTGSYYGKDDVWYRPRDAAEEKMYDHDINTTFICQYDPQFLNIYRYINEPGQFHTNDYLIWTICMYAIGVPVCVLPLVIWGIVKLSKKCNSTRLKRKCGGSCDCCRRGRFTARTRGIAPPMAYTPPPVEPTIATSPVALQESPREDPFAARPNAVTAGTPVLVPLPEDPKHEEVHEVSGSGSSSPAASQSASGEMPVY